jgi:hypothetical protein
MRKIEQQINKAIQAKKSIILGNTSVVYQPELNETMRARMEQAKVYLHGNHIATHLYAMDRTDYNPMTLAQWPTPTTKSRLRALGFNVKTIKGSTYVGDKKIV